MKLFLRALSVIFLPFLFLTGCAADPAPGIKVTYSSFIVRLPSGEDVAREKMIDEIVDAQVIYLGEKHDNPFQHNGQLEVLQGLIKRGKKPAIGFEFFSQDQTGWLLNYTRGYGSLMAPAMEKRVEGYLRKKLGWEGREDWMFYMPIIELARKHKLPVFGADLSKGTRVRLTRTGIDGMLAVEKMAMFSTGFADANYRKVMHERLSRSHCGTASGDFLERLYQTWLARNDAMAKAVIEMRRDMADDPVVMILGLAHVENDMGVYDRVAHLDPQIKQINIGFREMVPSNHSQDTEESPVSTPDHHYLWFTPPTPGQHGGDPCEQFRRIHKK